MNRLNETVWNSIAAIKSQQKKAYFCKFRRLFAFIEHCLEWGTGTHSILAFSFVKTKEKRRRRHQIIVSLVCVLFFSLMKNIKNFSSAFFFVFVLPRAFDGRKSQWRRRKIGKVESMVNVKLNKWTLIDEVHSNKNRIETKAINCESTNTRACVQSSLALINDDDDQTRIAQLPLIYI